MAVYAIGDIQGCHDEFQSLLGRLDFEPARDRLWLTGDLVARGPQSLEVLRTVRALGAAAITVLGNHDLHLLALARQGRHRRRDADLEAVLVAPDRDELLAWLAGRPLLHHDQGLGYTIVHAGLPPQWDLQRAVASAREIEHALATAPDALFDTMYGDEPADWSEDLAGAARLRYAVNCLTRLRYVDATGRLLLGLKSAPDQAPAGAMPWFRHPGRLSRGERIVFGHWSTLGLVREDNVLGIDTGCVWGGSLCAVRLDAPTEVTCLPCPGRRRPGED